MKPQFPDSSAIDFFKYDRERQTMDIGYKNGSLYRYFDVIEDENTGLEEAESKGAYVNRVIKKHQYMILRKRTA